MTPRQQADAARKEVVRLLHEAGERCKRVILNPPGIKDTAKTFHASRAAQQMASLNRELDALGARAVGVAARGIGAAYQQGLLDAEKQAREAGVLPGDSPLAGSFNVVDRRRAEILAQQAVVDVRKAIVSMRETTGKVVRQTQAVGLDTRDVNRLLAGGIIQGKPRETLRQLRVLIRKTAIDGKVVTVNARTGVTMQFKPDDYADLAMQTKSAETTTAAMMERLHQRGIYYVKVVGSNSRNFCTAFVGKVFWIGPGEDPTGQFPSARLLPRGGPPFHPRCTKRFIAFVLKLQDDKAIERAKLDPHQRQFLGLDDRAAGKLYRQRERQPLATPTPPPDRSDEVRRLAADARRQLNEIAIGTQTTFNRLQKDHDLLVARLQAAADAKDTAAVDEAAERLADVLEQISGLHEQRRAAGLRVVQAEQPLGISFVLDSALGPARRKIAEEGIDGFSKLVDRSLISATDIIVRVPDLAVFGGRRSYYSDGKMFLATSGRPETVVHELGHRLEDASPALLQASLAFLKRRTEGETLQRLSELTGIGYGPREWAWPDEFFNPYVGKDYGGRASEVVSMGLEAIWRDPIAFAARDPDYFDFLFKAVRGVFE